jgi:hypothetical protein
LEDELEKIKEQEKKKKSRRIKIEWCLLKTWRVFWMLWMITKNFKIVKTWSCQVYFKKRSVKYLKEVF